MTNFYPRPPRGGRLQLRRIEHRRKHISIHALREEGDSEARAEHRKAQEFLSTPSARRATTVGALLQAHRRISIHALREEGDFNCNNAPSNSN